MKLMVSYHYTKGNQNGFGNCPVSTTHEELTMELVRDIERQIKESNNNENVVILNIIKLDA